MTKNEIVKLKKKIEALLEKAQKEALDNGINITSKKFDVLLSKIKEGILKEYGLTLEEYENALNEIRESKENKENARSLADESVLLELAKLKGLGLKGEKGEKGDSIVGPPGPKGNDGRSPIFISKNPPKNPQIGDIWYQTD